MGEIQSFNFAKKESQIDRINKYIQVAEILHICIKFPLMYKLDKKESEI